MYIYLHIIIYYTCVSPPSAQAAKGSREGRASSRTDTSVQSPTATMGEEDGVGVVACLFFLGMGGCWVLVLGWGCLCI